MTMHGVDVVPVDVCLGVENELGWDKTGRCMVCASTHNRPIFKMGQIPLASTQGGSTQLTRTDTEVEWESSHPAK